MSANAFELANSSFSRLHSPKASDTFQDSFTMPEEEASEVFQEAKESQTSEDSSSPQPPPDQVPPEVTTPQPRVDGGLRAWLQVLGSFCLFFTSWGVVNSFGVYQTYYESDLLSTTTSASQISWIGSLQVFLLVVIGVITGPIFDRGYLHPLLYVGTFLTVFGLMMTSICTKYWQLILAQGLCVGLGSGCLFVPSIAIVATYFTKKRALATGLGVSGSSIGGIIYPIAFRKMQPTIGFGWATRVLGFITLALLLLAIAIMRSRTSPNPPRSLFQPSAFKSPAYTLQAIGQTVGFIGLYVPVFYIQTYAIAKGITSNVDYAFYLLPILNAGSFFGRILPNFVADKTGPMNMLVPCTFAAGILCLCWIAIEDTAGITVFAVLYGFFAGAYVSLLPPVIAGLTPDMSVVGTWMGMSLFVAAFGLLIGNPIVGAIINVGEKKFAGGQGFAGGVIMAGGVLLLMAAMAKARHKKTWKV